MKKSQVYAFLSRLELWLVLFCVVLLIADTYYKTYLGYHMEYSSINGRFIWVK